MKRIGFIILLAFNGFAFQAQEQETIDSLMRVLAMSKADEAKVEVLVELSWQFSYTDFDQALIFADQAVTLSEKLEYKKGLAGSYNAKGNIAINMGNYDEGEGYYYQALKYKKLVGDTIGAAAVIMNIGNVYYYRGEYNKVVEYYDQAVEMMTNTSDKLKKSTMLNNMGALMEALGKTAESLKYHYQSLEIKEEMGDKQGIGQSYGNIANILVQQSQFEKSLKYCRLALQTYLSIGNVKDIGIVYHNAAIAHRHLQQPDSAIYYENKGLEVFRANNDRDGIASCIAGMGIVQQDQGKWGLAIDFFKESLNLYEEIGNQNGISQMLGNLAICYAARGEYRKAIEYDIRSYELAKQIGSKLTEKNAAAALAEDYAAVGEYEKAYDYSVLHDQLKDSILNQQSQEQMAEMETKYQSEKKDLEIQALESQRVAKDAELSAQDEQIKRQNLQRWGLLGGLSLMLVLALVIFRSYRQKKKANLLISLQKEEVEHQKHVVEEKNQEITDSITYAQRIQEAILPPERLVKEYLNDSFILYKPKDIVAGDFYWLEAVDGLCLFAAADCTGHGVPGAMVSVVCHNALNRSVREFRLTDPGEILNKTRELVIETFEKSDHEVKDGMDIALCTLKGTTLQYAGANNPLWIYRKGTSALEQVEETKADKQPIGKYADAKPFNTHAIELKQGDTFYVFTDGYADQFGGEKGKKMKYKPFRQLLLDNVAKPLDEQLGTLDEAFETWKGDLEQVDDVCIIGVRV